MILTLNRLPKDEHVSAVRKSQELWHAVKAVARERHMRVWDLPTDTPELLAYLDFIDLLEGE